MDPGSTFNSESSQVGDLDCFAQYTSGATGAITTVTMAKNMALNSASGIVRSNTGIVVFTLRGPFIALLDISVTVIQASPSNTGGGAQYTYTFDASAGTITVTYRRNSDFAATDTVAGDLVKARFQVQYKSGN